MNHTWSCLPENRAVPTLMLQLGSAPSYSFSASQVPLYEPLESRYPELWSRISELVKAGRWEIVGGNYVEFEGTGPCGESLVRQFVHGKRFFRGKFGVDVKTCWQPDAWSHPWTLPQILRGVGIDTYFFLRGAPHDQFLWQGPDGSAVLAVKPFRKTETAQVIAEVLSNYKEEKRRNLCIMVGGGDHGGGLKAAEIEKLKGRFKEWKLEAGFARADRYAQAALKETAALAKVKGELGFEYPGSYTTLGEIKDGNRRLENLLLTAERFAAVAGRYQPAAPAALESAWNLVLFNQFHDIMGGCVIPPAYQDALSVYEQAETLARPVLEQALRGLLLHINTRGIPNPVVVFNPLSWDRAGEVVIPAPPGAGPWIVRDDEGRFNAVQVLTDPHGGQRSLLFVAKSVPAFGYRVYSVISSPQEVHNPCRAEYTFLETPSFRVTFKEGSGDIEQIRAKSLAWQVLSGAGNQIQILEDLGDSEGKLEFTGRSWTLGPFLKTEVVEKGPVRVRLRVRNKLLGEHTTFVREVSITDGLPWVDFETRIEWNSEKKFVKVAFPLALETKKSTWEIPFGSVERPNDGTEKPALRWVDLNDGRRGAALLNLNRYGYDVRSNVVRLSLLRSPTWPARNDEGGIHNVSYALYPHVGTWAEGKIYRRALEYNIPLIPVPADEHSGALPPNASFFKIEPDNVLMTACKSADDGDGIVLRFVEVEGKAVTASLRSHWFLRNVFETDLMEENGKEIRSEGDVVKLTFRPFEIKTVRLKSWGFAPLR